MPLLSEKLRHLEMPGLLDESERIFQFLASQISTDTSINIMAQYHPDHLVWDAMRGSSSSEDDYEPINRCITQREYQHAYELAHQAGLWRFDK